MTSRMTAEKWNMIRDNRLIEDKTSESSDDEKEERAMRQLSPIPTGPIQQDEDHLSYGWGAYEKVI